MRRNFSSAAGNIRLPSGYRASGSLPSPAASSVTLDMNQNTEFPKATRLDAFTPVSITRTAPDVQVTDVSTFSKNAMRQAAPDLVFLSNETENDIDAFYAAYEFTAFARKPVDINVRLQVPPQVRKRAAMPQLKILGVPDDW